MRCRPTPSCASWPPHPTGSTRLKLRAVRRGTAPISCPLHRTPAILRFLLQFNNALILFLLVAAALAAVMAWVERRGLQTEAARTMVVNMLCVLERNSSHSSGV